MGERQDGLNQQQASNCQPACMGCAQQLWLQLCACCCSSLCLAGVQRGPCCCVLVWSVLQLMNKAFDQRAGLPVYCSAFLSLQRLTLRAPRAVVFDEVGRAAMGSVGSGLVYGTIYLTILCEPIIFHLTCMETLRQVRKGYVCIRTAGLGVSCGFSSCCKDGCCCAGDDTATCGAVPETHSYTGIACWKHVHIRRSN
jgi:hypothetical protein